MKQIAIICCTVWFHGCVSHRAIKPCFAPAPLTKTIHLVSHGWHVGIAIQSSDIPRDLMPELVELRRFRQIEFGWGERDFYMKADPGLLDIVKAGLWANRAVLHVVGIDQELHLNFPRSDFLQLKLSDEAFLALLKFIDGHFARGQERFAKSLGPSLYGTGAFFAAEGSFSILRTCNKWTMESLKTAGLDVRTWDIFLAPQVMSRASTSVDCEQEKPNSFPSD